MQVITDLGGITRVRFPGLRRVLTQRVNQIKLRDGEALTDVGAFFIVECGDSISTIEATTGCYVCSSPFDDLCFGDEEFEPSFEWLEHHTQAQCFELAFITTDDYFVAVFVPDEPGIDADLLQFCRAYS